MSKEIQNYLVKVEDTTSNDQMLVIPYRPFHSAEKWLEYRFSEWNTWKAWFAIVLVVAFFALGGPGFVFGQLTEITTKIQDTSAVTTGLSPAVPEVVGGAASAVPTALPTLTAAAGAAATITSANVLQWLGLATLLVTGLAGIGYWKKPTHLTLSPQGISWEWRRWPLHVGRRVPWDKVERIGLKWPSEKTSPQDSLIAIETDAGGKAPMQIKLGGIATSEEREKVIEALEKWAPNIPRDAELLDILAPPADHSYTELWLQALSAPPKRERLAPLPALTMLRDNEFKIIDQLGVGGQGTAYLAITQPGAEVVLKEFILPVYVDINVRKSALERMQNEVQILKRLDNPRIVKLTDFFIEDHRGYLVLERIDGLSLRGIVQKEHRMNEERVLNLALQMCEMLKYLHNLTPPVVHRDFTPENLILASDGTLKLVDFNVAQQKEATATGTVVGKHSYIPPEQFRGKPNTQSDIYAMGATMFYLLTAKDPEPITSSHPKKEIDAIDDGLDFLIARSTHLDCKQRYQNIEELEADLKRLTNLPQYQKPVVADS